MKKKITISINLAILLALVSFVGVIAGSTFDFGTLASPPPIGQANWTAWINEPGYIMPAGMPFEVVTEDNTNSDLGVDQGYDNDVDLGIAPGWKLQVENMTGSFHNNTINMIFGGLNAHTGKLWFYNFDWNKLFESFTNHGTIPLSTTVQACPLIEDLTVVGSNKTVTFSAQPSRTYYVYKSTQASGAGNGVSNGRYLYLRIVTTNSSGIGIFTDIEPLESWYTVILRDDATNSLGGCHSDESRPTALTMGELTVALTPSMTAVDVRWNTFAEINMVGFNIYRAESEFSPQVKVNINPVPAMYSGQEGGDYLYVDNAILPGHTYYYWVEEINTHEWIGPESVSVGYQFYLPFILLN